MAKELKAFNKRDRLSGKSLNSVIHYIVSLKVNPSVTS